MQPRRPLKRGEDRESVAGRRNRVGKKRRGRTARRRGEELGLQKQKSVHGDPEHWKRRRKGTGDMHGRWGFRKQGDQYRDVCEKSRSDMMRVWL